MAPNLIFKIMNLTIILMFSLTVFPSKTLLHCVLTIDPDISIAIN